MDGVDAVVNFAAETHVDRSIAEPDAFVRTHAIGTFVLLEAARERGLRYLQVSTDEVYGSIEEGSFTEESPLRPSSPYSATKTGADLLVAVLRAHLRHAGGHLPRLEQLRPAPVPREADPADRAERDPRRPAARLRRRHAGAQLDPRARLQLRASRTCSSTACPARSTTRAGRTSAPNIDVVRRVIELTGRDESLIEYVTDRPGHDRRYSLVVGQGARARLGAAGALRRGPRGDRRLVPRQRLVVGADPLRRLPRVLRAPVRARAQRA